MLTCSDPVDFVEKSVDASLAAGDFPAALRVIATHWPLISATDGTALRAVIARVPGNEWRDNAWIIAAVGASYRSVGSPSRSAALPYFRAAEALIESGASAATDLAAVLLHHAACLRSLGRLDSALVKAEAAWARLNDDLDLPPDDRAALQAAAALQLGMIKLHRGDYAAATANLRLASGLGDHGLTQAELVECHAGLSLAAHAIGDFQQAEKLIARTRAAAANSILLLSCFGAAAVAAEVLIAVDRHQLSNAQAVAPQLLIAAHRSDWEPLALYAQAAVAAINGQLIEALDFQRRSIASARGWEGVPVIRTTGEILRCALHIQLGDADSALDQLRLVQPTQDHADCPAQLAAGILLGVGDSAGSVEELRSCHLLDDTHSSRTMVSVLLLTAAANYELGALVAGDIAFDRALYLGSQTGIRVPFLVIPRAIMLRMLDRATDRNQPASVHRLLEELRGGGSGLSGGVDPLSDRERDIAQHLFQDKTISQIAAELFISTNTVKTHVRSIYRKLSATSRKEAIQRARELGLDLNITPY